MNERDRPPRWPWLLVLVAVVAGVAGGWWVYATVTGT